jgi:fermentation-respiration switch protein FrsA (DUF1100 family)
VSGTINPQMNLGQEFNRPGLSIVRVGTMIVLGVMMFAFGAIASWAMNRGANTFELISPTIGGNPVATPLPNPYSKYSFDNLSSLQLTPGPVRVESLMDVQPSYATFLASWDVPDLESGTRVKVTGQINIPQGDGPFPVIVMLRGYADREIYTTGLGTRNAAAVLARNGYITIAPDFQGFGGSGPESNDILVARFSRPLTVLQLLRNLQDLRMEILPSVSPPPPINKSGTSATPQPVPTAVATVFDTQRIGIWAHSNGGQIALSVLEITNRAIPTTLWAPVSQAFPYSVLYYTDESPDGGKYLREQLARFEFTLENDPDQFTVLKRADRIIGPIQIHQGGADDAVPLKWSQQLYSTLKEATVAADIFVYPQADHNLQPNWDEVVQRDLLFFGREL